MEILSGLFESTKQFQPKKYQNKKVKNLIENIKFDNVNSRFVTSDKFSFPALQFYKGGDRGYDILKKIVDFDGKIVKRYTYLGGWIDIAGGSQMKVYVAFLSDNTEKIIHVFNNESEAKAWVRSTI